MIVCHFMLEPKNNEFGRVLFMLFEVSMEIVNC